jgi:hypothetical protein
VLFSATTTKLPGIENVTSWPKIGEMTLKDAGEGPCADAAEATSAPSVARQMPALRQRERRHIDTKDATLRSGESWQPRELLP